jgi:hypothetical protein
MRFSILCGGAADPPFFIPAPMKLKADKKTTNSRINRLLREVLAPLD